MCNKMAESGLLASLIMTLLCPAFSRGLGSFKFKHSIRLRGGSCAVSDVQHDSLPNPRLYQPAPPTVSTKVMYAPDATEEKQDIKECQVIGSWSNWLEHEPLIKNAETGVWEIVKLLQPGEYHMKFVVNDRWKCSSKHSSKVDDGGFVNNIIVVTADGKDAEPSAAAGFKSFAHPLNGNVIPSNGLHAETSKVETDETSTLPPSIQKATDDVDVNTLGSDDTGGKSSETLPIIEPESEPSATNGKEVLSVLQTVSENTPVTVLQPVQDSSPESSHTNISHNCTVPTAITEPQQGAVTQQESDLNAKETIHDAPTVPSGDTVREEPNRLSMEQLKEQSAQQRAAIAELQENLDKARAHAKELLDKVSELEKARACQETSDRSEELSQQPGSDSVWGALVSSVLGAVHRVVGSVWGTAVTAPPSDPTGNKSAVAGEQDGRALSIARQFDNLWVRLRGGERCKSSSELNQVGGEEVDKALKQAGAQAAQALSRIEALELSISRLIETAAQDFPLESERRL